MAKRRPTPFWIIKLERRVRHLAEERAYFIPTAIILALLGVAGIVLRHDWSTLTGVKWLALFHHEVAGAALFDTSSLILAACGFIYAIYSIKGLLERPRDLLEVVQRTADLIKRYRDRDTAFIMLCEYPAWGALSIPTSDAYAKFYEELEGLLTKDGHTRLILLTPDESARAEHIKQYANNYGHTANIQEATKNNTELIAKFKANSNHFKTWPISPPPYQMLLVSEEKKSDKKTAPAHLEAIVWFALRSPQKLKSGQSVNSSWKTEEVLVMSWQITDPWTLEELYENARFFASPTQNITCYEEFAGLNSAQTGSKIHVSLS